VASTSSAAIDWAKGEEGLKCQTSRSARQSNPRRRLKCRCITHLRPYLALGKMGGMLPRSPGQLHPLRPRLHPSRQRSKAC
jgi:hypothetical protein